MFGLYGRKELSNYQSHLYNKGGNWRAQCQFTSHKRQCSSFSLGLVIISIFNLFELSYSLEGWTLLEQFNTNSDFRKMY